MRNTRWFSPFPLSLPVVSACEREKKDNTFNFIYLILLYDPLKLRSRTPVDISRISENQMHHLIKEMEKKILIKLKLNGS